MSLENNFQHDELSRKTPGDRLSTAEMTAEASPDSPAWLDAMAQYGLRLSQAGVRAVLFMHGSLHGTDLFGMQRLDEVGGLKRGYSRGVSGLDALLSFMRQETNGIPLLPGGLKPPLSDDEGTRKLLDGQAGDAGNFTNADIEQFCKAINRELTSPIHCQRLLWSSEHHHLGRAIAAVRTLDTIRQLRGRPGMASGHRILVLAHGQAGLVLALISNLICQSAIAGRPKLLELLKAYGGETGDPGLVSVITRVEPSLGSDAWLGGVALDLVTFGCPVRYGWDPSGIGKLLHIVNHRNLRTDGKTWLAKIELPQITVEMPVAWGGDYVQALAVAGSDAMPGGERARAANKALWEIVEPYDGFERWLECARRAVRFPSEGRCLLADYRDSSGSTDPRDHYYGHAAYTRRGAVLFNTRHIIECFYS